MSCPENSFLGVFGGFLFFLVRCALLMNCPAYEHTPRCLRIHDQDFQDEMIIPSDPHTHLHTHPQVSLHLHQTPIISPAVKHPSHPRPGQDVPPVHPLTRSGHKSRPFLESGVATRAHSSMTAPRAVLMTTRPDFHFRELSIGD